MTEIILRRDASYSGKLRSFAVYIDDSKVGTIKSGETQVYALTYGRHAIQVKLDEVVQSPKLLFDVRYSEEKKLFIVGSLHQRSLQLPKWSLYLIVPLVLLLSMITYLNILSLPQAVMAGVTGMLLLGLFSGRNNYLSLVSTA